MLIILYSFFTVFLLPRYVSSNQTKIVSNVGFVPTFDITIFHIEANRTTILLCM